VKKKKSCCVVVNAKSKYFTKFESFDPRLLHAFEPKFRVHPGFCRSDPNVGPDKLKNPRPPYNKTKMIMVKNGIIILLEDMM
jgi:hypothetical protein